MDKQEEEVEYLLQGKKTQYFYCVCSLKEQKTKQNTTNIFLKKKKRRQSV